MSKSKKNTIDPEKIIENYGADSVRLFILSDSPPEKDVQWSEEGIVSSYKFIQKLWNLNSKITNEIAKNHLEDSSDKIFKFTNKFIEKITINLENFSYNKIVANTHEMYSFLYSEINNNYSAKTLLENYKKILICISPIAPHLTNECLKIINQNNKLEWPTYDKNILIENSISFVIQINGKKRGLINTERGISEENLLKLIYSDEKLNKYLIKNQIKNKIFVKDKLINLII